MTKRECAIVSAYTGIMCGDFDEFHKYIEELLGRPVWTHELANKDLWQNIKELSKEDFCNLGKEEQKTSNEKEVLSFLKKILEPKLVYYDGNRIPYVLIKCGNYVATYELKTKEDYEMIRGWVDCERW